MAVSYTPFLWGWVNTIKLYPNEICSGNARFTCSLYSESVVEFGFSSVETFVSIA
jgi:hypothetical protein